MLNKAMMGDRLGTTSQAETGLLPPFVCGGSLRREEEKEGEMGVSTISLRKKSMQKRERDVLVCVFVCSQRRHKQTGRGRAPVCPHSLFCLQKQTPSKTNSALPQEDRKQQQE